MKKQLAAAFTIALLSGFLPQHVFADIEWNVRKQLKLEAAPIDVVSSIDGKWIYVLIQGEILIYSAPDYKIVNRIPLDKSYDRLSFSAQNNTLIVSSSGEKAVRLIELTEVHRFSLEGLPFKGNKNAPVTLVAFSDYQ